MKKILIINGPNLNLLGQRQPELYGRQTLQEINKDLERLAQSLKLSVDFIQSNHEGELISALQRAAQEYHGAIINAAAYTHTSLALRDTILAINIPVIEVHLTNPAGREDFRQKSYLAGAAVGLVAGFGPRSYELALHYFSESPASPLRISI
ncbi:MAG: type II 3-dehydroquinate dehydratase [Deltaproteobacteria bacterium]|jgi:3-dehydroquinate dehydratase-2|nr:type II 3-dehydroquinate dehydratase [Deltaproteobacteria bacterium]